MKDRVTKFALVAMLGLSACSDDAGKRSRLLVNGDPDRGKTALTSYGCVACHTIPGVRGSNSLSAPPLIGISQRSYLAGMVENTPDNLRTWIQHPHKINPHTAMPEQGVTDQDASDMAAYLYQRAEWCQIYRTTSSATRHGQQAKLEVRGARPPSLLHRAIGVDQSTHIHFA